MRQSARANNLTVCYRKRQRTSVFHASALLLTIRISCHTSTVNNLTLPSRPSIAQAAQGKRKASENKEQSTAPKKTKKNPKNKAWNKNNGIDNNVIYNTQHSQKTCAYELNLNPVVLERSKEE